MVRRIFPYRGSQDADGGKYLLGEGDQQAAEQTQKALGALAGVVGLDGHTDLDDAPAQDDDADGPDRGEDEVGQVVDDGEGVRGSPAAARAGTVPNVTASTAQAHTVKMRMIFGWLFFIRFLLLQVRQCHQ